MILPLFLFALACSYGLVNSKEITFKEGTNTTVSPDLIVGSDATLRCTVKKSNPEVVELDMLPPPSPEDNWKITHDETEKKWVEVVITNVSHKNAMNFTCFANNSKTISFLTYELSVYNGTTFNEGTNTTVVPDLIVGSNATLRCTINASDPEVVELDMLPPPSPEDNWKITQDETGKKWVEVVITNVSHKNAMNFTCSAKTNITTTFLTYDLSVYNGTTFNEGTNTTVVPDLIVGSDATLRCTVNESDPEVVKLDMLPPPKLSDDNWEISHDKTGKKWVEVVITNVSHKNAMNFTCSAKTNVTTTFLTYDLSVYNGTTFNEGTNTTVVPDLIVGSNATLRCTINASDPDVVELDMLPPPKLSDDNWEITHDKTGKKWVEVVITNVSHKNTMNFTCSAKTNVTTTFLTYDLSVYNGTTFNEGTNTTIASQIVNGYNSTFRCTVDKSDPPVVELSVQPRPGPEDNWKIKTNGTEWIEVIITKASNMTSKKFECSARNNVTTSFLTYELSLVDPDGPYFIEGTNKTIWSEIKSGSNASLTCTVKSSIPPVTELKAVPHGEPESNWVVKRNGTYSIEVIITKADISNAMNYTCTASNGIRTSTLDYQNFVGGKQ